VVDLGDDFVLDGKIVEIRVGFLERAEALDWSRRG